MGKKHSLIIVLIFCVMSMSLFSQSLIQIGYIIKKALPDITNVALIGLTENQSVIEKKAKMAQLITKLNFKLYLINNRPGISIELKKIFRMKNVVVVIITKNKIFNPDTIKYFSVKLYPKKIPLITDRQADTFLGAMITVCLNDENKLEYHISKLVSNAYGITFDQEFEKDAIVDVE